MKLTKSDIAIIIASFIVSILAIIAFAAIIRNKIDIEKNGTAETAQVEYVTALTENDIFEILKKSPMSLPNDNFYYNLLSSAPKERRTYIDLISLYPANNIGKPYDSNDYYLHSFLHENYFDAVNRIDIPSWLKFNEKYLKITNPDTSNASYNLFYGDKTESYSDYDMEAIKEDVIPVLEDMAYKYISSLYFEKTISDDILTNEFCNIYVPQAYRQELLKNDIYPDKIYRTLNKFEEEVFISTEKVTVIPSFVCSSFFVPCNYTILLNFENSEIPIDVWDVLVIKPVYNESSDTFSYKIDYSFNLSANSGENAADLTDLAS